MHAFTITVVALCLAVGNVACDGGSEHDDSHTDADADTDSDVDTDTDVDTGYPCGPDWEPFGPKNYCALCNGTQDAKACDQECINCPDGQVYLAECDRVAGTCRCLIDGVEICTCTSTYPDSKWGCQPEAWGGVNCCWIAG
jgi:hypothetical protein